MELYTHEVENTILATTNGHVKLFLPQTMNVNMELNTLNGKIHSDKNNKDALEINVDKNKHHFSYGEHHPTVQASTMNGNIYVKAQNYCTADLQTAPDDHSENLVDESDDYENADYEIINEGYDPVFNTEEVYYYSNEVTEDLAKQFKENIKPDQNQKRKFSIND
jgi:hypothetical protein